MLQHLALHGIPGLGQLDEHGNPTSTSDNPLAQAALASAAAAGTGGAALGEKEGPAAPKRSAFDRPYHQQYQRGDRRGGRWGDNARGGRYGHDDVDPYSSGAGSEEFDIVALEDDKTVEISIIGSPATVSEAELLLRTHIGLITQIYKLSYDEAMLERQVHALSLVVPQGKGPLSSHYAANSGSSHGYAHDDRERRGDHGRYEKKRGGGKDEKLPAWMNDNVQSTPSSGPAIPPRRGGKADPSVDIHAARLKQQQQQQQQQSKPAANGAADAAAPGVSSAPQVPSYKNAAIAGATAVVPAQANSAAGTASTDAAADVDASSDEADASAAGGAAGTQRKRGGRREKEKQAKREQRNNGNSAQAAGENKRQQRGPQRGRGGNKKDAAAPAATTAAPAAPAPVAAAQ